MTPSLSVLTALAPTLDTSPLSVDCPKRHGALPPFGVMTAHTNTHRPSLTGPSSTSTTPTASTGSESECDAYDASSRTNRTLACPSQWTGMPIRAIVPLPRRKLGSNGAAAREDVARSSVVAANTARTKKVGPPCPLLARPTHVRDDDVDTDSGAENGEELVGKGEDDESDEDRGTTTTSRSRCCSYESITAAQGLSAWSFEELRVECYAQSFIARGTKPPPVVQPLLAIPPAFVPRIVVRS